MSLAKWHFCATPTPPMLHFFMFLNLAWHFFPEVFSHLCKSFTSDKFCIYSCLSISIIILEEGAKVKRYSSDFYAHSPLQIDTYVLTCHVDKVAEL